MSYQPPDPAAARRWPPFAGQPGQACGPGNAELFYPPSGPGAGSANYNPGKAICARCPLRRPCRRWALATRQQHGLWGGLTPADRRAALRGSKPEPTHQETR